VHSPGTVYFEDLQNVTNIAIRTIDDDVPEMALDYNLHLIAASGEDQTFANRTCVYSPPASNFPCLSAYKPRLFIV